MDARIQATHLDKKGISRTLTQNLILLHNCTSCVNILVINLNAIPSI
jgi:hypothetical protein